MEEHDQLSYLEYEPAVSLPDEELGLPEYHLVETCIPSIKSIEECHSEGYMFVVVGQEIYDDSPFTLEIENIITSDVNTYYLFIVLIFFSGNLILFVVLWSWLRIRVTERMVDLTMKLETNDQSEKRTQHFARNNRPNDREGLN